MLLYKYCPWNDEYTKNNILNNTLYFNTASNFNDPFDVFPSYATDEEYIIKIQNEILRKLGKSKEVETINATLLKSIAYFNDRSGISKHGISCFSQTKNCIHMWSHYANKHHGLCLEFEVDLINLKTNFFNEPKLTHAKGFPIEYVNKRPIFNFTTKVNNKNYEYLRKKSKTWEQEQELRIMIELQQEFPAVVHYLANCLIGIYLGATLSVDEFQNFYNFYIKNNLNIPIKIMHLDQEKYKLIPSAVSNKDLKLANSNINHLLNNFESFSAEKIKSSIKKYGVKDFSNNWKSNIQATPISAFMQLNIFKEDLSNLTNKSNLNQMQAFELSLIYSKYAKE